jgi:hypothetical protein
VLVLTNGVINALYHGADGVVLDGMVQTLRINGVGVLGTGHGLWVRNTAHSSRYFPQFIYANDLEIDGAAQSAVRIDAGSDFHFVDSDISNTSGASHQGSLDGDCFVINPDLGASITRNIFISDGRLGNCQGRALFIDAQGVHLTGENVRGASKAGVAHFPYIEVGAHAVDVEIAGGKVGYEFGDAPNGSYGVVVDEGAQAVAISGVNFSGAQLGAIKSNSEGSLSVTGGLDADGGAMPLHLPRRVTEPKAPESGTCYYDLKLRHGRRWDGRTWVVLF